jgi:protein-tyrosine phosphatase
MIDLHCHPLPEVDDGAENFDEAVAMCRMAAEDGITHLVATPHCSYRYEFHPEVNRQKLNRLQSVVGESLRLLLGCDFHLSFDNIQQVVADRSPFTINGTRYLLVEFDEHFIPEQYDHVFYDLQVAGITPIITHPERNPVFRRRQEIVYPWVTRGCLVQITAQSYTGGFGSEAQRFAEMWLANNLVHFFASDAHDTRRRPPVLSKCYQKLAAEKGEETAERLMKANPKAVIQGRPLPPAPEPVGPDHGKRRSWLSFFRKRS